MIWNIYQRFLVIWYSEALVFLKKLAILMDLKYIFGKVELVLRFFFFLTWKDRTERHSLFKAWKSCLYICVCILPGHSLYCLSFFSTIKQKITDLKMYPRCLWRLIKECLMPSYFLWLFGCIHHGLSSIFSIFQLTSFCLGPMLPAALAENFSHSFLQ